MRLIDANKLKEAIICEYATGKKKLMEVINEQPAVLDTNIIREQLIMEKANLFLTIANTGNKEMDSEYKKLADWIDKIIEIMEGGVVDEFSK